MARKRKVILFRPHIPLYPGQDDDLIRWLESLENVHFGAKSQAVKEALRRGLAADLALQTPAPQTTAPLDLGEIRAVVEAAVESALARLEGLALARSAPAEEDETEQLLDDLGAALVL